MKSLLVGLLAVFALSGCGVGMDDPEGEQAALGSTTQAVLTASGDNSLATQTEIRGPITQDPLVALPQDPIPDYEGKAVRPVLPRLPK